MATGQWNDPKYTNPLPEWKQWPSGGWGYADPNITAPAGSNNPVPGGDIHTPIADIEAAQAANAGAGMTVVPPPASVATSSKSSSSTPKPVAAAAAPSVPETPFDPGYDPFAAMGGGVRLANGAWVPKDSPLAGGALWGGGLSGGGSSSSGSWYSQGSMDDLARQKIIELLNTPQNIDQAELDRSPEAAANRLAAQRAYERNRATLAEQNAAAGLAGTGGAQSGLMRLQQSRGESEVAFMGGLAGEKLQANRARLEQGIQFALSQGQFVAAEAMKEKLANLDAAIRREQIAATVGTANLDRDQARELGLLDLGYRYDALGVNANKDAALALMNQNFY